MFLFSFKKVGMYKIIFFISFLFIFISCGGDSKIKEDGYGALKIIITNNTEYDIKELYYKVGESPSNNNYGIKLNTEVLADKASIEFCPTKEGDYYFTFVRQNGSNNTDLYISSEYALNLNFNSGILNLELLAFNFYYESSKNESKQCTTVGD